MGGGVKFDKKLPRSPGTLHSQQVAMLRLRRHRIQVLACTFFIFVVAFFHFSLFGGEDTSNDKLPTRPDSSPLPPPKSNDNTTPVPKPEPPTPTPTPKTPEKKPPVPVQEDEPTSQHDPLLGQDGKPPTAIPTPIIIQHWMKYSEHFPIPSELLISLPTSKPKVAIGRVQATFAPESESTKTLRLQRRQAVKDAMVHSWKGYKQYAWGRDEVTPLTAGGKDKFGGWAASLVDALDTLWIMDLKEEFEEAIEFVKKIDFTTSTNPQVAVFETTIRYLGGLLGAYDISGHKYPILLEKATQLGDVLFGAFDTPNRMPLLYYPWHPDQVAIPKRAPYNSGLAEMGTLSLEFTRLAQLTGNQSYFDAIQRITDGLAAIQYKTSLPGMWPTMVDATGGCYPPKPGPIAFNPGQEPKASTYNKRQKTDGTPQWDSGNEEDKFCIPVGIRLMIQGSEEYTFGSTSDSFYEYLLKMHLLLGGATEQYGKLYNSSTKVGKKLLFRPKLPGSPDILLSGSMLLVGAEQKQQYFRSDTSHLACFTGGMFALGSRTLGIKDDLEIGRKLTDGCVTLYNITATGIMPESVSLMDCGNLEGCEFNEKEWWKSLMPEVDFDAPAKIQTPNAPGPQKATEKEDAKKEKPPVTTIKPDAAAELKKEAEKVLNAKQNTDNRELQPGQKPHKDEIHPNERPIEHPISHAKRNKPSKDPPPTKVGAQEELQKEKNQDWYSKLSPKEKLESYLRTHHTPPGVVQVNDPRYLLRPEAIESVFIMYRITGDPTWQEKGWHMWESTVASAKTPVAFAEVVDVLRPPKEAGPNRKGYNQDDSMESFWLAETLKYYYLLYSEDTLVSLDDYVLNTEAHPLLRKKFT